MQTCEGGRVRVPKEAPLRGNGGRKLASIDIRKTRPVEYFLPRTPEQDVCRWTVRIHPFATERTRTRHETWTVADIHHSDAYTWNLPLQNPRSTGVSRTDALRSTRDRRRRCFSRCRLTDCIRPSSHVHRRLPWLRQLCHYVVFGHGATHRLASNHHVLFLSSALIGASSLSIGRRSPFARRIDPSDRSQAKRTSTTSTSVVAIRVDGPGASKHEERRTRSRKRTNL